MAEIVRVDSKGRITIPMVVREALGIVEGMNLVLIADIDKKEIVVSPLPARVLSLYEFYIELKDVPGALARVSNKLAELGVDQLTTQCTIVKRGELAECIIIADISGSTKSLEEIRASLTQLPEVRIINIRQLRR